MVLTKIGAWEESKYIKVTVRSDALVKRFRQLAIKLMRKRTDEDQ